MNYTKREREEYNQHRDNACGRLGITKAQYNYFRRMGEKLHKVYEMSCNGDIAEDAYDLRTSTTEAEVRQYLIDQKLYKKNKKVYYVYFQTDPRGATIYLDTQEIPSNNYTQAVCIY